MSKLEKLCLYEGKCLITLITQVNEEGKCPGICMNEGCDFVTEVEESETKGECPQCKTPSVMSATEVWRSM